MTSLREEEIDRHKRKLFSIHSDFPGDYSLANHWLELLDVKNGDWKEAYRVIRKIYLRLEPKLLEENFLYFKAYGTDFWRWMNEVEQDFYHQYRCMGGVPLYPLYFANGYYLDFANPKLKIGIEIDGKKFHDANKDRKRDQDLADFGWKIYRITAADVLKDQIYLSDLEERLCDLEEDQFERAVYDLFNNYASGLVQALRILYFDKWKKDSLYYRTAEESLYRRMLAYPREEGENG